MRRPQAERKISRQTIYRGRVLDLFVDQVRIHGKGRSVREVVGHSPAVAVVPVLADGTVLLVRQYRYAVGRDLWELPAGLMGASETPRQAARRELREETGYQAQNLKLLASVYSSPGFCREKIHVFLAIHPRLCGAQCLDPDESVAIATFPWDRALAMARQNKLADGKTVLGILLAEKYRVVKKRQGSGKKRL